MGTHCILFCGKSFVKVFEISQVPLQRTIAVSWRRMSLTTVFAKWFKARSVAADYLDELHVLALIASKLLHSFVCHLECIVQVVDDRDLAPMLQQAENSMTTCESCHRLEVPCFIFQDIATRVRCRTDEADASGHEDIQSKVFRCHRVLISSSARHTKRCVWLTISKATQA